MIKVELLIKKYKGTIVEVEGEKTITVGRGTITTGVEWVDEEGTIHKLGQLNSYGNPNYRIVPQDTEILTATDRVKIMNGGRNMKLTVNEVKLLNGMRTNEYNDAYESHPCGTWSFTAIDYSGIEAKKARGVISSLVKKGLVSVTPADRTSDSPEAIGFTQAGLELFANADGEKCSWGGPKLLKEIIDTKEAPKTASKAADQKGNKPQIKKATEIEVFAFTGMSLGVFPIISQTAKVTTVQTKKGELSFNTKTGAQLDAKNPKFGNKLTGGKK